MRAVSTPAAFSLEAQDVQLWAAALDQPPWRLPYLLGVLSDDERARADRFVFERDRRHFVVARAFLRLLLGRYLGADPSRIVLAYGPRGKPSLGGERADAALQFNVAHSHGVALYAFTYRRAIGVDVELVRHLEDMVQLARLVCSPRELTVFLALPPEQQANWFFKMWTRKEAIVKATGDGLAQPLQELDVSSPPGDFGTSVSLGGTCARPALVRWTVRDVTAVPGYAAAIAVEGPVERLTYQRWE